MFDSIMKELFLQAQDWESETLMPLKKGKRYELKVTYKPPLKLVRIVTKANFISTARCLERCSSRNIWALLAF